MEVSLLSRHVNNFQCCVFEDLINELVAPSSICAFVRRTIQLHHHQRAKPRITNHKIDVFGANAIEVRLPARMTTVRIDKVS